MNVDDQCFQSAFNPHSWEHLLDSRWEDHEVRRGFTRKPQGNEHARQDKNYITPSGLQRLKDEHWFLLTRDRPAVAHEDPRWPNRAPVGPRALTGGAIAAFIGVLLRILGPDPVPGAPLNPRLLAYLLLGIGIFLLIIGLLARAFFRG